MRNRKFPLLLCIPFVAVFVTGCADQGAPSDPGAKANQKAVVEPPPVKGTKAAKKPKELNKLTAPTQLVE
jgi:hypothetical protein